MSPSVRTVIDSPIGPLLLTMTAGRLTEIGFDPPETAGQPGPSAQRTAEPFGQVIAQLDEYFGGRRRVFDLPLSITGTDFQRRVWQELQAIPYGETISYGQLAERIGNPRAVRAVGLANGRNRLPIVIPCHRVIGADGKLVGFGGGLPIKAQLLDLERPGGPLTGRGVPQRLTGQPAQQILNG